MKDWTRQYDNIRKKTALLVAILILCVGMFGTAVAYTTFELAKEVDMIEQYEKQGIESFFQLALIIDHANLNALEGLFESMVAEYGDTFSDEYIIERFTHEVFNSVLESAILSIFIAYDNDDNLIRMAYREDSYNDKIHLIKDIVPGEEFIIIGDTEEDLLFGQGERIYLSGRRFDQLKNTYIFVYVGFEEQIRFSDFITTLETGALSRAKNLINKIALTSMYFVYAMGVVGVIILGVIRKYNMDMLKAYTTVVAQTGVLYPQKNTFGEIAMKEGYLTTDQVEKCLEIQAMELYKKYVKKKH